MARIKIVTDSACDFSTKVADEAGITIVPLSIRFGQEEFTDGVDLTTDGFWARCADSAVLPETSAPSPGAFQAAFLAAADEGYDGVICLDLSGGVSATHQSATTAATAVADRIEVVAVDSRSLTMGLGLMALDLADRAAAGATMAELQERIAFLIPRTQVFGVLDTLDHLAKGGRIGGAQKMLGSLLSIKPVVSLVDGMVAEESKQRTRSRSLAYLADKARNAPPLSRLAISNGAAADLDDFLALVKDVPTEFPLVVTDLGPVVGTHTGPGTIGLSMILAD